MRAPLSIARMLGLPIPIPLLWVGSSASPVLRPLGNRLLLPLGLAGGLAFALATATIAFIDTFDPLFPVAGLAGVWLVATGAVGLTRGVTAR